MFFIRSTGWHRKKALQEVQKRAAACLAACSHFFFQVISINQSKNPGFHCFLGTKINHENIKHGGSSIAITIMPPAAASCKATLRSASCVDNAPPLILFVLPASVCSCSPRLHCFGHDTLLLRRQGLLCLQARIPSHGYVRS